MTAQDTNLYLKELINLTGTSVVSGTVAVSNFPATQTVSGSVNIGNSPAVTVTSGSINATCSGTVSVGNTVTVGTHAVTVSSGSITVSGAVGITGTPAVTVGSGTVSVSNLPVTQAVSGTVTVTSGAITNISNKIDAIDENIYQCLAGGGNADQLRVYITGGTSTEENSNSILTEVTKLSECVDIVNHHIEVDTNAINGVTMSVNSGVKGDGVQRMCIATDDINVSAINTNLASQNKTLQRLDSIGSLESTLVSEYKLLYKSWYPSSLTGFSQLRFESFSSGAVFSTVGGGSINPNQSSMPWQYSTRFSMCNGQNGLLFVYPVWGTRLDSNTPTLEVGLQYYDNSSYIKLVWDHAYTSPTEITLYWVANLNDMSGGVGMSSWNVDAFNGSGLSGVDLRSSHAQARCMLSPFIALGSSNNMVYVGFVFEGRLWVGHQFSLRFSGTQAASGASGRSGVRPYYKLVSGLGAGKTYSCGGFEIYTRHNFYNVLSKEPFCYYGTAAVNTSTTIYPMAIYMNSLTITATPICMKEIYVKTIGTSDVGDFRVEVYHCVDTQFTYAGGSTTTNNITQILKAATSFGGGTLIATYLPTSDNCIRADLSWIDWKYFGFDQNFTAGTTNVLYFLIINMSASVNKTAYWSITWTE